MAGKKLRIKMDVSLDNHKITDVANPEAETDAANKAYVDEAIRKAIQALNGEVET